MNDRWGAKTPGSQLEKLANVKWERQGFCGYSLSTWSVFTSEVES